MPSTVSVAAKAVRMVANVNTAITIATIIRFMPIFVLPFGFFQIVFLSCGGGHAGRVTLPSRSDCRASMRGSSMLRFFALKLMPMSVTGRLSAL